MKIAIAIVFTLVMAVWWAEVAGAALLLWSWALPMVVTVVAAIVTLAFMFVRRAVDSRRAFSRGFFLCGVSALGALPLALAAMQDGAEAATETVNPFSAILSMPLAAILVGNLKAGVILGATAAIAAAAFGLSALLRRDRPAAR